MWLGSADRDKIQIDVIRPLSGDISKGVTYLLLSLNGGLDNPTATKIMNTAFTLCKV